MTNYIVFTVLTSKTIRLLKNKLCLLSEVFENKVELRIVDLSEDTKDSTVKKEYIDILKTYWGHGSFRKLKMYNINSLDNKEKRLKMYHMGKL